MCNTGALTFGIFSTASPCDLWRPLICFNLFLVVFGFSEQRSPHLWSTELAVPWAGGSEW